MSRGGEITLEGQAVEEILREARRSKELANDFGLYRGRRKDALPNKRFLNNTLVSTLRHSYREEKKHRDGSHQKFQQHMRNQRRRGRNYYKNQGDREEIVEPDKDEPEPDYGEFDAIAYTEKCTDLYIRDSHRKHFFMRRNFVEKDVDGSSSDSDESFTEYDDLPSKEWKHDRFEGRWTDTGSADEYASGARGDTPENEANYDRDRNRKGIMRKVQYRNKEDSERSYLSHRNKLLSGKKRKDIYYQDAGTSKYDSNREDSDDESIDLPKKKLKNEIQDFSDTDEDSDREYVNSGTESADNMKKPKQNKGKGKKTKKLPDDGKELWEKISSRSMYADIEEMKLSNTDPKIIEDLEINMERKCTKLVKLEKDKKRQEDLKQTKEKKRIEEETRRIADRRRKEEEMRDDIERRRKNKSERRLAERNMKENEIRLEAERKEHRRKMEDMHLKEQQMRWEAFEHFRGSPVRRQMRGRPFLRPGAFYRGRPPRGFRGGFPMFPHINPFCASLFSEIDPYLLQKFIKQHRHKLLKKYKRYVCSSDSKSRSRSRSYSRSRSHRYKKKRRYSSGSDSSYSKDRSRSHSRRHSSKKSSSYSRAYSRRHTRSHSRGSKRSSRSKRKYSTSDYSSRSRSRSRSRTRSRSRSRTRSRSTARTRSRSRSRTRSRSKSRSKSRSRSRSKSRGRSKYRKRSYNRDSSKNSQYEDSHRSHSRSSRKRKKHRKHKKSKHRKHSKSKHRSKKQSESAPDDEKNSDNEYKDSDKAAGKESSDSNSEIYVGNEDFGINVEQVEESEGEIVSDDNDGLENVSEDNGEAWSSSSGEEGAVESD